MELFKLFASIDIDLSALEKGLKEAQQLAHDADNDLTITAEIKADTSSFDVSGAQADLDTINVGATADITDDTSGFDVSDVQSDLDTIGDGATAGIKDDSTGFDVSDVQEDLDAISAGATAGITDDSTGFDVSDVQSALDAIDAGAEAEITADVSDITSGADDAASSIAEIATAADEASTSVNTSFSAMDFKAIIDMAQQAADAVWGVAFSAAQAGDTIDKQSQMIGISAKAYQAWDLVLSKAGTDISVLRTVSRNFTAQMGSDEFRSYFDAGMITGADGSVWSADTFAAASTEDQINAVLTSIMRLKQAGGDVDEMMKTLLGSRAYQELMPLINGGVDAFEADYATGELNAISDTGVKASAALVDAATEVKDAWDGVWGNLLSEEIYPFLTDLITQMTTFVQSLSGVGDDVRTWWTSVFGTSEYTDNVNKVTAEYQQSVIDETVKAAKANTLVTSLSNMASTMGDLATGTNAWSSALSQLKEYYPELESWMQSQGYTWSDNADQVRDYINAQKQLAIYQATQTALKGYQEAKETAENALLSEQVQQQMSRVTIQDTVSQYRDIINRALNGKEFGETSFNSANGGVDVSSLSDAEIASLIANNKGISTLLSGGLSYDDILYDRYLHQNGLQDTDENYNNWYNNGGLEQIATMTALFENLSKEATDIAAADKRMADAQQAMALAQQRYEVAAQIVEQRFATLQESAQGAAQALDSIGGTDDSNANGLSYVPYDGYTSTLHRGEAVLTTLEAERWRNGGTGSGTVIDATASLNIGTYVSNGPGDERTLVAALVREQKAQLRARGEG